MGALNMRDPPTCSFSQTVFHEIGSFVDGFRARGSGGERRPLSRGWAFLSHTSGTFREWFLGNIRPGSSRSSSATRSLRTRSDRTPIDRATRPFSIADDILAERGRRPRLISRDSSPPAPRRTHGEKILVARRRMRRRDLRHKCATRSIAIP